MDVTIPQGSDASNVIRVERKGLFRRQAVLLVMRGRVFIQLDGRESARRGGWMTRTVCDSYSECLQAREAMLDDYLSNGYSVVLNDSNLMPPLPEELFDPELNAEQK